MSALGKRSIEAPPIPDNCDAKPYGKRADQCPIAVKDVILKCRRDAHPREALAPLVLADAICLTTVAANAQFLPRMRPQTDRQKRPYGALTPPLALAILCSSKRSVVIGPGVLVSPAGASDYLGASSGPIHVRHTRRQSHAERVHHCRGGSVGSPGSARGHPCSLSQMATFIIIP